MSYAYLFFFKKTCEKRLIAPNPKFIWKMCTRRHHFVIIFVVGGNLFCLNQRLWISHNLSLIASECGLGHQKTKIINAHFNSLFMRSLIHRIYSVASRRFYASAKNQQQQQQQIIFCTLLFLVSVSSFAERSHDKIACGGRGIIELFNS